MYWFIGCYSVVSDVILNYFHIFLMAEVIFGALGMQ
jgi:hypothetical protein